MPGHDLKKNSQKCFLFVPPLITENGGSQKRHIELIFMKGLIADFIRNNNLNFDTQGTELNLNCVILCVYACWMMGGRPFRRGDEYDVLMSVRLSNLPDSAKKEIINLLPVCMILEYGEWWGTEEARKQYVF